MIAMTLRLTLALLSAAALAIVCAVELGRLGNNPQIAYVHWYPSGYSADIFLVDVAHRLNFNITPSNARYVLPKWSPDGAQIAYIGEQNSQVTVYVADADGRNRRALYSGISGALALAWSPDGRSLLTLRPIDLALRAIHLIDVSSGSGRDLVQENLLSPTWSPDGSLIAYYTQNAGPQGDTEIWLVDLATGQARFLAFAGQFVGGLVWSPDSRRLAFSANYRVGRDVLVVDLATGVVHNLTEGSGESSAPQWSPDGRQLVFVSDQNGTSRVQVGTFDAANALLEDRRVIGSGWSPQWSPDGAHLTVLSETGLNVLRRDGQVAASLRLTTQSGSGSPVWRP